MAAGIVLALAGVFSDGPLSSATAKDPAGRVTVDYERFLRQGARSRVHIRVDSAVAAAGATVRVGGALAGEFTIESLHPHPLVSHSSHDALLFRMAPTAPGAPLDIHIAFETDVAGSRRSEIGLEGQPAIPLFQFVYP